MKSRFETTMQIMNLRSNHFDYREDEYLVEFWSEKIQYLMREVRQSLTLSKSQIIQDFKLHNVVPLCLSNILQTLAK